MDANILYVNYMLFLVSKTVDFRRVLNNRSDKVICSLFGIWYLIWSDLIWLCWYFIIKVNVSFKIFGRYFYLKVFSSLLRLLRNFSSSVIEFYQILCESLNIHIFPIILFMNINEISYINCPWINGINNSISCISLRISISTFVNEVTVFFL